ncbi:MAG: FGGY family carbohydrate kinase [Propionibacteriaceae bacterium]|nr:FGGY family carbohydrate kinase [Propionibacteriaceae bacterium]
MTPLVAGLDLGTSSAKLVVVDLDGTLVAEASEPYPTHTASGGVVEQDAEHWWLAACTVLQRCGVAGDIVAIGLTGQMQDLIPVANGRALRPAILYSDTRASIQQGRLVALVQGWEQRTGNHQDITNVAAKIAWLTEHEPDVVQEAEHLLLSPAGFVAWRAGATAACDVTTASTTGLLDVAGRDWLVDVVTAAGVRVEQLPRLVGSQQGDAVVGEVGHAAASQLGLKVGTPLVLAMGDAGATTDGLVGSEPGDAYLYLGTTGWLAGVTPAASVDSPSPIHSLVMPGWSERLRVGAVQSAGSASAWALHNLLPGLSFAEAEKAVAPRLSHIRDRPLGLPGLAGERTPVRDGDLRGAFIGVEESTTAEDLYLSVLTGVAMGLRHAADAMGVRQDRIPLVGGASVSGVWRQLLADVFEATIVTGVAEAPGAHSAARAAADAIGLQHRMQPVFDHGDHTETIPSSVHSEYQPLLKIHRGLYDALKPTFSQLSRVRSGRNQ